MVSERRLFICKVQTLNHFVKNGVFLAKLIPEAIFFFMFTSTIEVGVET